MNQRKMIFVFPGQGSQKKGMLAALAEQNKVVADTFEQASDILGYDMKKLCFEDPESQLGLTEYTQPALLATSIAIWRALQDGARDAVSSPLVAGHSLGEYSALVAIQVLDFAQALRLVRLRGKAMQEAVPLGTGGMAALVGDAGIEVVEQLCVQASKPDSVVEIANENSPGQLVVSGHLSALERFTTLVKESKAGRVIPLPVSAPFHSSLMQPAAVRMKEALRDVPFAQGQGRIVANVDARLYESSAYGKELLVDQIVSRVRWTSTNQFFLADSPASVSEILIVEVGSGAVLQGLMRKSLSQGLAPESLRERISLHGTDDPANMRAAIEALRLGLG